MTATDTRGLMDGKEFRESLKKYKPTVYVDGQLIESVVMHCRFNRVSMRWPSPTTLRMTRPWHR